MSILTTWTTRNHRTLNADFICFVRKCVTLAHKWYIPHYRQYFQSANAFSTHAELAFWAQMIRLQTIPRMEQSNVNWKCIFSKNAPPNLKRINAQKTEYAFPNRTARKTFARLEIGYLCLYWR